MTPEEVRTFVASCAIYKLIAWFAISFAASLALYRWQARDWYRFECELAKEYPSHEVEPLDTDAALRSAVWAAFVTVCALILLAFVRAAGAE